MVKWGMPAPAHLKVLSEVVKAHLECRCRHKCTDRIVLRCGPKAGSAADVATFTLIGHPRAVEAYAWTCRTKNVPVRHIVLKVLPIWDASDAVESVVADCKAGSPR